MDPLFLLRGDTLKEYQQLGLETTWDGEMYLQQIVKMSERVILSPTVDGKNGAHQNLFDGRRKPASGGAGIFDEMVEM